MKISALDLQSVKSAGNTNFRGLRSSYDKGLNEIYKFYAPAYDRSKYSLLLQLCPVKENGMGGFEVDNSEIQPFIYPDSYEDLRDYGITTFEKDTYLSDKNINPYMGYRFVLVDNEELKNVLNGNNDKFEALNSLAIQNVIKDPGTKTNDGNFTVISNNMGITPNSGSATHIFYDSFDSAPNVDRKSFIRTHFNKAGGDLDALIKRKDELEPFTYVMTNPYMGRDSISSHKYWGEEFFQMPSSEKFKDVVVDLFKEGKGYIADGAFTSQSLQSPLFQNVLMYGKDSPFYNWFKINGRLKLGVIPDTVISKNGDKDILNHLGYKIVNPLGVEGYNPKKPSYIQFFDDRLSSTAQQNDNENLIRAYDKFNTKDPYDVSVHQDSILPYYFELDYSDPSVVERFSGYNKKMLSEVVDEYKNGGNVSVSSKLSEHFSFKNYEITTKGKSGGANYWAGNVDMVKMNLANPQNTSENIKGYEEARNQLYDVATYWTKFANDAIVENLAHSITNGRKTELRNIISKYGYDTKNLDDVLSEKYRGKIDLPNTKENLSEVVDDFKFEAVPSIPPQMSAIFSSSDFQNLVETSGIKSKLENITLKVLANINDKSKDPLVEYKIDGGEPTPTKHGLRVADHIIQNIASYAVIKSIFPDADIETDGKKNITRAGESLRNASIYSAGVTRTFDMQDETEQLVKIIDKKLQLSSERIVREISKEYKDANIIKCSKESFTQAQMLARKLGGGLNWRFDAAKDVGDFTANHNDLKTFEQTWDEVIDFWGNFVSNVREINPSSYVVAEVTDLWSFYNSKPEDEAIKDFGKYFHPEVAERMLYEKTSATTGSNYSVFFNLLPDLFGQNFEHGNVSGTYANMDAIKGQLEKYLNSGPLLYLTHSHIFTDNHDKPRALHCLALDMGAYLSNFSLDNGDKETKPADVNRAYEAIGRLFGDNLNVDIDAVSSKAVVVADTFLRNSNGIIKEEQKEIFVQALRDLALGKFKNNENIDYQRAETFGQNPFDITLHQVMEQAEFIAQKQGKDWLSDKEQKEAENKIYASIMKPALVKMIKMTDVMTSVTGIPFTYAGDNLGQTGYEYASKNIAVANRNLVKREWIDSSSKDFKPEIKEFYNRMQAMAGLHKKHGLSAIAGGMPISLPQDNGHDLYAIYKYDDKDSNVIQVFSNVGMNNPLEAIDEKAQTGDIYSIKTIAEGGISVGNTQSGEYYKRCVYDNKTAKFVDETDEKGLVVKYVVVDGALRRADGEPFKLNDTVTNFYKTGGTSAKNFDVKHRLF